MKILTLSDTHSLHYQILSEWLSSDDIDTIIHTGDVSKKGSKQEIFSFLEWFSNLKFKNKIMIAGNHDFYFEEIKNIPEFRIKYPDIIYLNDSGITLDGYKIWGSPVQPFFHDWAFNKHPHEIIKHWNLIPDDTDILLTHGPALGILDESIEGDALGCPKLLEKIKSLDNLKLHCHGHIHEAYGTTMVYGKHFVNSSLLNRDYYLVNKPYIIEFDENKKIKNISNN